jgi:hypothetical protein
MIAGFKPSLQFGDCRTHGEFGRTHAAGTKVVHEARVLTAWMNAAIATLVGHPTADAVSSVAHKQLLAPRSCLEGSFVGIGNCGN